MLIADERMGKLPDTGRGGICPLHTDGYTLPVALWNKPARKVRSFSIEKKKQNKRKERKIRQNNTRFHVRSISDRIEEKPTEKYTRLSIHRIGGHRMARQRTGVVRAVQFTSTWPATRRRSGHVAWPIGRFVLSQASHRHRNL